MNTLATLDTTTRTTMLLRPRRASESKRRTQVQIPLRALGFFTGALFIENKFGEGHRLIYAFAHGMLNTVKVEVPEIMNMIDPVLRLTRDAYGVVSYEAFDAATDSRGAVIVDALRAGFGTVTRTTLPAGQEYRATWYQIG